MTADRQNTPQDAPHARLSDFQAPEAPGDATTAHDAAERAQRYAEALGKAACRALASCGDFHRHEEAFTRAGMAAADLRAALASVAPDTATPGEVDAAGECAACGHRHSPNLGGICIGCPCEEGGFR